MNLVEDFKPISVKYDESLPGHLLFAVRCLVDLQVRTIYGFLKRTVPTMRGRVLDVGCGESPYAHLLTEGASYIAIDIADADRFGMSGRGNMMTFDGRVLPFSNEHFDHVVCTEVIEHVEDPEAFVSELRRVLKSHGTLVATIPFSARVHHEPFDYQRFTFWGLKRLFSEFSEVSIAPRGSDLVSIAAKLVVVAVRLSRPRVDVSLIWRLPSFVIIAPALVIAMVIAHAALVFDLGSKSDPLGYSIYCVK
jgi:SAM-dependent methyltransferase